MIFRGDENLKKIFINCQFFCQTSFWQNDLVLLVDIES